MAWPQLGALCQLCHAKTSQPPKVSKVSRVSLPWSPSQSRFRAVATLFLTPWLLLQCLSFSLSRVGKETPGTPEEHLHGSAASGVVNRCFGPGAGKAKEEDCALEGEKKARILVLMMSQNVATKCSESFRDLLEVLCSAT